MRGELGSAFGVSADEFHQHSGIDGGVSELVGAGVDGGKFDVKHLDEGFDGLLLVAVWVGQFNLGALAVELGDAELFAMEADFGCGEEVEDGLRRRAVAVLQFSADIGEVAVGLRLRRCVCTCEDAGFLRGCSRSRCGRRCRG